MTKRIFLPYLSPAACEAYASVIEKGSAVFFTVTDAAAAPAVSAALEGSASVVGWAHTPAMTLEDAAPATVQCAETLGGIDELIFMPQLPKAEPLFLDIPEDSFLSCTSALNALFSVCKCALPYMLGETEVAIKIVSPEGKELTSRVYRAAVEAFIEALNSELSALGIRASAI